MAKAKALLWSPGRSSHFWNIQTPPNLKKTSAISRAGRDFIALRTERNTHRPACGTANTSLIWGGIADQSSNFPIPHVVRQLRAEGQVDGSVTVNRRSPIWCLLIS
ncbi:hypothetical protein EV363DRAFT_1263417 [Boletus edulis]|nr:hypothetical protein EV363DRAFT_1263417 [Boletus edulis]